MTIDTMPERVRQILADQQITKARLAATAKVSKGAVTQWATGDTDSMSFEAASSLAREYGYSTRWLIEGVRPRWAKENERFLLRDQDEHELIELWRELVPPQRADILAQMRELREHNATLLAQLLDRPKEKAR